MRSSLLQIIAAVLMMNGCASLNSFQEMSSGERARFVCSRQGNIVSLDARIQSTSAEVSELETVVANGYRVHETCQRVRVDSGNTRCTSQVVFGTIQTNCYDAGLPSYDTVCQEIPVAIDGRIEEAKLTNHQKALRSLRKTRSKVWRECFQMISDMSAEAAFEYYDNF